MAYVTITLAALLDIKEFEFSDTPSLASFVSSWICLAVSIGGILLAFCLYWSARGGIDTKSINFTNGVFSGLKDTPTSRLMPFFSMSRKILTTSVVVFASLTLDRTYAFSLLAVIQGILLVFMVCIRPFALIQNNLLQVFNELFILGIISFQHQMDSESSWSKTAREDFMNILILNCGIIVSLLFCAMTINTIKGFVKCFNMKNRKRPVSITSGIYPLLMASSLKQSIRSLGSHSGEGSRIHASFYDLTSNTKL
ncbi:unnamed protein product [Moneuplotes crassus]|uniref:Uncharacterized protein n=1 Tax=Euplotes crassus TaxID=5936 RepID=A0AAD1UBN0_EUPCR|nr:unnamed protein product [Moneuplotes crassus]